MPKRRTIAVAGMTCTGCEKNVENALKTVPGVRRVEANHDDESVEVVVDDDVDDQRIGDAVYDAGYEFVG
ncbi:heavy-metal-associated domain-containing protein [Haloterrigena sp. SYSU A558-1]|uniref:Heavy-metal-associated domain-containing protein n=1 Tax=Haloterrigena gelatinilytica TaxID=2741724 RepID=A0A8J8GMM9_9EURY|nr:heavy metal-associated domain-containing protein [Haloterrigena gelatinilytica]NUB91950.1 heavy-metal-associated domain-containing protein [Haloterrigena gelatinilytica]NUC72224.1 heavy-metal-associated domain-containing protein [Haloterrigena gelatinilytica]